MEELFSTIATVWEGGLLGMQEAGPLHDMLEDSIAKASEFFQPVESVYHKDGTSILLEDYSFGQDSLYSHANLSSMGIVGQDALDMMLAYEGTNLAIQEMDIDFSKSQKELCSDFMVGVSAGLNGIEPSLLENLLMQEALEPRNDMLEENRLSAIEEGMEFAREYKESHPEEPNFSECFNHFKESQANSIAEIAELMDEKYGIECTMQHFKDLLSNGFDSSGSVEKYEDTIREYFAASAEYVRLSSQISFKSRESMLPYEEYSFYDVKHPERNPFGVYVAYNYHGDFPPTDTIAKPYLPDDLLDRDPKEISKYIRNACDIICDAANLGHLHIFITTDEAKSTNGTYEGKWLLPFTLWDNAIYINRDYMETCIKQFGTMDVILFLIAHEIGHAVNEIHCGRLVAKDDENLADMFSGIVLSKMGVDTDIIRQWNQWEGNADPNFYKPIEGRWDAAAAGTYWTEMATLKSYTNAIEDPHFRELAYNYNTASEEMVSAMAQKELDYQINEAGGRKDNLIKFIDGLKKYMLITRL